MKRPALVFDLDDTLYAEREFVLSGFTAVDQWLRRRLAINGFATEARELFAAGVRGAVFDQALDRLGVNGAADLVPELVAVYRAHQPRLTLLPEARWAMDHFRARCRFGLITDGYAQTQRNKVAALGISGCFDCLVFTDDLGRANWKPSPAPFHHLMDHLGCTGAECIYVADNPAKDFVAPNQLGWLTVRIRREGGEYEHTAAVDPAYQALREIRSLFELRSILG